MLSAKKRNPASSQSWSTRAPDHAFQCIQMILCPQSSSAIKGFELTTMARRSRRLSLRQSASVLRFWVLYPLAIRVACLSDHAHVSLFFCRHFWSCSSAPMCSVSVGCLCAIPRTASPCRMATAHSCCASSLLTHCCTSVVTRRYVLSSTRFCVCHRILCAPVSHLSHSNCGALGLFVLHVLRCAFPFL